MKCPHCHAENQNGFYCAKCGKPLDESVNHLTRVMPPLEDLHNPANDTSEPLANANDADDSSLLASDSKEASEVPLEPEQNASDAETDDTNTDAPTDATEDAPVAIEDGSDKDTTKQASAENTLDDIDDSSIERPPFKNRFTAQQKKLFTIIALIGGIALAAFAGTHLFSNYFGQTAPVDPATQVKNADSIAPDTSLAEDAIVGHWRHYNTGSVIEKIGTGRYRWTIEKNVYQLDFKDNKYIYEDKDGNTYIFVLVNADRIQLAESKDANGGLITNPVFESGFIAGRVGQDGTMTKNLSVNPDAFNITGRTYADLAGTYGPGALSVVGDEQYIIFRADGGNFAVQFAGETVPLKQDFNKGYKVVTLTNTNPVNPNEDPTVPPTDPNTGGGTDGSGNTTDPTPGTPTEKPEDKEYKVEIPDMPTFPSNTAIATGVVWADLGFVIKNAPDTMTVNDLSAVLGISLEVGQAPANASGFNFYGMEDGYFAGTYGINDHSFYISGYGKNALSADKTILFIQQIS